MARLSKERLLRALQDTLTAYVASNRTRTDLLKDAASLIVDLRNRHQLEDGRPDLSGRSPEYRREMGLIYKNAGVTEDTLDTVQAALRYHVGNLLRETKSAEDLAAVGLTSISPRARLQRSRELMAALAASVNGAKEPARMVAHAEALVDYVTPEVIADLGPKELEVLRVGLRSLVDRCNDLLETLDAA